MNPRSSIRSMIVNQHSPYILTHKVKSDCTDTVVTLTVPLEIKGWKVDSLGIKGRNSSESDPGISEQRRQDIIKADQNRYAMYLNCMNKYGVHIPYDTPIEIVGFWPKKGTYRTIFKLLYQDICQYRDVKYCTTPKRKNILELFMLDRSVQLLPEQTLNFRVVGYNHNPVNIERVEFKCGFDLFNLENLNVKQ